MKFVIKAYDKPNSLQLRLNTREQHLQYLNSYSTNVIIAGPLLQNNSPIGSCLLVQFSSQQNLDDFLQNDPYNKVGLFNNIQIQEMAIAVHNKVN